MTRLFPDAKDYRTMTKQISKEKLEIIEKKIGVSILPGQRKVFQYFEMLNNTGDIIGYTMAVTQKGEFGAIEFVYGLNKKLKIVDIYIQRSRERDRKFKEPDFLKTFIGKGVVNATTINDPLGDKGNIGTKAIVNGIRKELVSFDELILKDK